METTSRVRFTTHAFHRMAEVGLLDEGGSYELLDGSVYRMAPESYDHARRVTRIADLLRAHVRRLGLDPADHVREGHPIVVSGYDEPEPDVVLLRGEPGRTPRPEDVLLVVEVSRTTYERDRGEKWRAYAAAGLPEYWIVRLDPDGPRRLEVYRRPAGDAYLDAVLYDYDDAVDVEAWAALGPLAVDDVLG